MGMRIVSSYRNPVTGELRPYVYLAVDNAGNLVASFSPFAYDPEMHDNPVVLSPDKTTAWRWRFTDGAAFVSQSLPVAYGTCEYVIMNAPDGTQWVYYPYDNNGNWTTALWTAGTRSLTTTLMHKKELVWVADNRHPTPRKGDI